MGHTISSLLPQSPLWAAESLNLALQLAGFAVAAPLQTEKFYDAFGCLGFLSVVLYSFFATSGPAGPHSARSKLATVTTLIWSLRLGSFLLHRVVTSPKGDSRFYEIKRRPLVFFGVWLVQAAWVAITSFPVVLVNVLDHLTFVPLGLLDYLGLALWVIGLVIEVGSDRQKSAFNARQRDVKEKRWIDEGLWKYSRHPNYFGESILWAGQYALCYSGIKHASRAQFMVASISPIFVTLLLTKVSGVPLLEKSADKKWGHIADYQRYKRITSLYVPWPRKQ